MSDLEPGSAQPVTPPPDADNDAPKGRKDKKPKSSKPRGRPIALETELEEFFTQLGAGVMMVDQFDGLVVINQAGENARALSKLANKNARVKKALEALVSISSMGAVVGVVGGTAVPILMHHGIIPAGIPMSDEWLKPPERVKFEAEVQEAMANNNGNGQQPTA